MERSIKSSGQKKPFVWVAFFVFIQTFFQKMQLFPLSCRDIVRKGIKIMLFASFPWMKGGENKMKPSTFQETTENQFDYICKKVIEDERKDYYKQLARLSKKEVSFSEIGDYVFNQLGTEDHYTLDQHFFELDDIKIGIENEQLGEALDLLSEKKRKIVLLYYFMDMNEGEIADVLHVSRSTVNRQRTSALSLMKECIEEDEK